MARHDNEVRITTSVLDRLIDYEPELSQEPQASRSRSLRLLKQNVRRDLEWLLNTRQLADALPPEMDDRETAHLLTFEKIQAHGLADSLLAYGLPDFTNANVKNPADQTRMRRALESAIRLFEPRLDGVVVTFEPADAADRVMKFRIDGRLKIDPAPEKISFDTVLEVGRGEFVVKGDL